MAFTAGSQALAYHGPLIYSAKVLQVYTKGADHVENAEGESLPIPSNLTPNLQENDAFLLHYRGWNPKWDEWVPQERVLPVTEANLELQKQLKLDLKQSSNKVKKPSKTGRTSSPATPAAGATTASSTTPATPNGVSKESLVSTKSKRGRKKATSPEIELPIPPKLKYLMVDDWENITKHKLILQVPAKTTVLQILSDYRHTKGGSKDSVVEEIVAGLQLYFDRLLGLILLYRFERLQYLNLLKKMPSEADFRPLEVYGLEHLLRLFTALPGLISQTTMDPVSVETLFNECKQLLKYIDDNIDIWKGEYINVDAGYQNLATQN